MGRGRNTGIETAPLGQGDCSERKSNSRPKIDSPQNPRRRIPYRHRESFVRTITDQGIREYYAALLIAYPDSPKL